MRASCRLRARMRSSNRLRSCDGCWNRCRGWRHRGAGGEVVRSGSAGCGNAVPLSHGWRHHNSGASGSYAAAFLKEAGTSSVTFFTTLAGEPATTQLDGTLRVTTLLAPTTPPAPIVTPLRIVTP